MPPSLDIWSRNKLYKIGCQSKIIWRNKGLSNQWPVEPMGCRTNGLSNQWVVGPMGCRTNGLSDYLGHNRYDTTDRRQFECVRCFPACAASKQPD